MGEQFSIENQIENAAIQRELQKKRGLERLKESDIDPENYRQYFDVLRKSDVPLKQALPDPHLVAEGILSADELKEMWSVIKDRYESIDTDEQTEETGREIINKMKPLANQYAAFLDAYADEEKRAPGAAPSNELLAVRKEILKSANEFNALPAYLSYRLYGMYEVDPATVPKDEYFRNEPDTNG